MRELPGGDLIQAGLDDLARGVESVPSLLVSIGAPRLRRLGYAIDRPIPSPEHRLYELLRESELDGAHSRYNALIRWLVSFERAAECARPADADSVRRFMKALGAEAGSETRAYFAEGATAVLLCLRRTTIDVDIKFVPESDKLLRVIPRIKETLSINVELASPADFIPVPSGWEERSRFIAHEGGAAFYHFDLYAQALAKVERGHAQDVEDVRTMLDVGLIASDRALQYFEAIEPELYRFPAIDPASLRGAVQSIFGEH